MVLYYCNEKQILKSGNCWDYIQSLMDTMVLQNYRKTAINTTLT